MYYFVHGEYFMLAKIKIISVLLVGVCDLIDYHHVQSDLPCYLTFYILYDNKWNMWDINVRENRRVIKNEQSRDTGSTGYTRHRTKTNKTKTTTKT